MAKIKLFKRVYFVKHRQLRFDWHILIPFPREVRHFATFEAALTHLQNIMEFRQG